MTVSKLTIEGHVCSFTRVNFSHMSPKLVRTYPRINSRKPGNYNETIIFEIGIMKKSYPINSKFKIHTVKIKMALLFWCNHVALSNFFREISFLASKMGQIKNLKALYYIKYP